jgi:dTDP-4-dehydrorhamnose reductase
MKQKPSTDKPIPYCSPEIWGGIECTINRVNDHFFDQLEYAQHYSRTNDIAHLAELGIKKIRYPVLWEKHQPTKDAVIDWTWIEGQLSSLQKNGVDVIAGLTHHGSGPAFTNLSDPQFPYLLAQYAKQVAQKFPWIEYYTPVNEPLTTARFSGLYGIWYPHKKDDKAFIQMLVNQVKGIVLSMQEIRKINPDAQLIQTEDLSKTYGRPKLQYQIDFENERRWLSYDLLYGLVDEHHPLWYYFKLIKFPLEEFEFFKENKCVPNVFGFNHYVTSERYLDDRLHLYPPHTHGGNGKHKYADVEAVRVDFDEDSGVDVLLKEAWQRYRQPMAVTEVHLHCHREEQLRWFKHVWTVCNDLVKEGVNIMLGSYGWNKLLTQPNGDYEPGVFDLRGGHLRPTALAHFIKKITDQQAHHPCSTADGWWRRHDRFIHQPGNLKSIAMKKEAAAAPVLIIGKRGTLGRAFAKVCEDRNLNYKLLGRDDCDICDLKSVERALELYKPWAVINAAGYVRVDDAERDCDKCFADNTTGPQNLAIACNKAGIKLVTFSSDLVFDGNKNTPYVESDLANPLNIYGSSKLRSEELVKNENPDALIIRTSAFFGPWDEYNFVYWVRRSLSQFETVTVAKDIHISPTYVPDLVNATLDLAIDDEKGIWHLANKGQITWAALAYDIAGHYRLDSRLINPVLNEEMGLPAKRPTYSVLGSERAFILPSLEDALRRYYQQSQHISSLSRSA